MRYAAEGVPLAIIAGREYGSGSSRDWAAKGPALLGVRMVLAESFERIHRSNLVGMGILPLQFKPGDTAASLGLTGRETLSVSLGGGPAPRQTVRVTRPLGRRHGTRGSMRSPASTGRSTSSTTAPAGSCRRSSGGSPPRPEAGSDRRTRRSPRGRNRGLQRGGAGLSSVVTRSLSCP